jgi:hypothetical protein
MEDRKVGRVIRASRVRLRMRQVDVEPIAQIDQTTMSLVEAGAISGLTVGVVRAAANAVGVTLDFEPRLRRGGDVARLLDAGHAQLVEAVIRVLRRHSWIPIAEYTFSHYGERGSVDIVAWHPATATLIIVEIKTRIVDVQELLATLDRKCRVVPQLLARDRGWRPGSVGRVVVVLDASTARRVVARHASTFESALPARSAEVRRWVRMPSGPIAGLWFLSSTTGGRARADSVIPERVRRPSGAGTGT